LAINPIGGMKESLVQMSARRLLSIVLIISDM